MSTLGLVIAYSLAGGIISLIGGAILLKSKKSATKLAKYATPFAAGALLAAVFLDLLPEGIAESGADTVLLSALIGLILFFLAERFLRWFHHHHAEDKNKSAGASLIIVGDTLHNALDGVAIAAGFLVSVPTGIVTTLAVAAHEIPQEIGDFGLLLNKGLSKAKVLLVNVVSALATVLAAVVTFALGDAETLPVGVLLGLSAGFLLYIAASDIIPEIHEKAPTKRLLGWQPMLLIIGVVLVGLIVNLAHDFIGHDHGHGHSHSEEAAGHEEEHHHEDAHGGAESEHHHEEGHKDGEEQHHDEPQQ